MEVSNGAQLWFEYEAERDQLDPCCDHARVPGHSAIRVSYKVQNRRADQARRGVKQGRRADVDGYLRDHGMDSPSDRYMLRRPLAPEAMTLDDRLEFLESRVQELEEILGQSVSKVLKTQVAFGFTPMEAQVFNVLLSRDVASADAYLTIVHGNKPIDDHPDTRIYHTMICKIRKKLPPSVKIDVVRTYGYKLSRESKRAAQALIDAVNIEA